MLIYIVNILCSRELYLSALNYMGNLYMSQTPRIRPDSEDIYSTQGPPLGHARWTVLSQLGSSQDTVS